METWNVIYYDRTQTEPNHKVCPEGAEQATKYLRYLNDEVNTVVWAVLGVCIGGDFRVVNSFTRLR